MKAADTNIVVRLITGEPEDQLIRARAVFANETIFLPVSVILEAEWVLRRVLRRPKDEVLHALISICGLDAVVVEHRDRVSRAFDWAKGGLDFADALHLALSDKCEAIVSFDRRFGARAARMGLLPPVIEP